MSNSAVPFRLRRITERRGRLFTPAVVETIREFARQGKSAPQIAAVIGPTPGSVRVKCCQLKISLARGRPGTLQIKSLHRLVVSLHPAPYAALKRKSAEMQKSAAELAGLLLQAIVSSDLYEAVLDGDEGASLREIDRGRRVL